MLHSRAVDITFSSLETGINNWSQADKRIGLLAKFVEVWRIGVKHTPIRRTPLNVIISLKPRRMTALVARTGRHQQRYEQGYRLVAGCVPYRYRSDGACNGNFDQILEVLMITSQSGQGLLFPKGGWETDETVEEAACREALEEAGVRGLLQGSLGSWDFKSKRQQGDCSPEGLCRAHMFALAVTEQLDTWPEQHARQRQWFTVAEAIEQCRHDWMRGALDKCISYLSCKPAAFSLSYETSNSTDSISHFSSELQNED